MEADIELLAAARNMNGDALIRIFDLYAHALYKYAFRFCHNAMMADQIVGDVFAKLAEQFSTDQGPRVNLRSHLFEMTYHLLVDEVRYSQRWAPIHVVDTRYTDQDFTTASGEEQSLVNTVMQAITNHLTEDQRHVLILRFTEGFSLKETAVIIGKKVGNVKVIQNRAIAALREALDFQIVETGAIALTIRSLSYV